jgi:hypothetical protein
MAQGEGLEPYSFRTFRETYEQKEEGNTDAE